MHFFSKTPSTSSLPSSPSVFFTKDNTNTNTNNCSSTAGNSWIARGQSFMIKKLERQRKPRHVSEQDLGSNLTDRPKSPSGDPDSAKKSRSPRGMDHRSSVAVPHPLPVPESLLTRRQEPLGSILGHGHLGSPEEGLNHVLASHSSQVPPVKTVLSPDHSPLRSPKLQSPCVDLENKCYSRSCRKLIQGSSKEWPENSCVSAHPRSAPISGLPSPATVSPRRSYTRDFLPSFVASQESQVRPTLKIPDLGRLASHSSQVSPVKTVLSPDHSPLRSPKLQSPCVDLENKCYSRSRRKLLQGSSKEWPENSRVSAHPFPLPRSPLPHPLPLPPGAGPLQSSMPSPPTSIHNTLEKRNEPLRKNPWVKGKLIGCGSYGRVYRGTNRVTGASCAMKEVDIIPGDLKSAESVKQLEQEIRVLRDLKHPNIVQYYGCEIVDEQFYIYLEYINPGSINKYVQEQCGHLPESIVRNFTRHILSGLAYLHSKKTVHRDIKGANLLVDASGVVKLTDFGTAKHLTGLSYELSLKGSPHWMAPEVIKAVMLKSDNPELALAVDTWSLGCTIIEMVTGKPPWGDLQGAQAMFKILNKDPPIPENLSSEGKDFLRCCFRRNPAERPSAMMLLDHPFVCKSNDLNVSACREAVPALNPVVSIKY
ncbi:mitogen-activated protein kinase kinase kinase [Salix suchowensis]|nr:mitogen-activated protein kinase kinase kinase [Salix suchowensis]